MKTKVKKEKIENIIKRSSWYYINSDLTAENFPIPEKIETEGWKLIRMDKSFSSQEALDKIKADGCRPANAYELALWSEKHREEIPKEHWCLAFGQLWQDAIGYHRVPRVDAYSDGDFKFGLGYFGRPWGPVSCLLAFCDSSLSSLALSTSEKPSVPFDSSDLDSRLKAIEQFMRDNFKGFHV